MPWTITNRPNLLSGVYAQPYLIRNAGSVDVLLGQDSSLAPGSQSLTLSPGSTFQWSGESELWAMTVTGTSSLETMQTAGSVFTPAPANVNLNPGATVGLDPSSTVGLNPGSSVGLTPGTSVDTNIPAVPYPVIDVTLSASNTTYRPVDTLAVSGLSSMTFSIQNVNVGSYNPDDLGYRIQFVWEVIVSGVRTVVARRTYFNSTYGLVNITTPVYGTHLTVEVTTFGVGPFPGASKVQVCGFRTPLAETYSHQWRVLNAKSGTWQNDLTTFVVGTSHLLDARLVQTAASGPSTSTYAVDTINGSAQIPFIHFWDPQNGSSTALEWSLQAIAGVGGVWSSGDVILSFPANFDLNARNQPVAIGYAPMRYKFIYYGAQNCSMRIASNLNMGIK
ncbi:hypothetical protein SEA_MUFFINTHECAT_27 [Microbacterium phage MuffinTheCat]|nr:hypothetical protein SEA_MUFFINTHECAT_27 [Microbacterium phage MuffinTheCat]